MRFEPVYGVSARAAIHVQSHLRLKSYTPPDHKPSRQITVFLQHASRYALASGADHGQVPTADVGHSDKRE